MHGVDWGYLVTQPEASCRRYRTVSVAWLPRNRDAHKRHALNRADLGHFTPGPARCVPSSWVSLLDVAKVLNILTPQLPAWADVDGAHGLWGGVDAGLACAQHNTASHRGGCTTAIVLAQPRAQRKVHIHGASEGTQRKPLCDQSYSGPESPLRNAEWWLTCRRDDG